MKYQRSAFASAAALVNSVFDRVARPELQVLGRSFNSYLFWNLAGVGSAVSLALALATARGVSLSAMMSVAAVVVALSVLMFKGAAWFGHMVPKVNMAGMPLAMWIIWAGAGIYHYQVMVIASAAAVPYLFGQPVLPYLDVAVTALCLAQVNGRTGCFMAGCCHGRPFPLGVRYGDEHLSAGYFNYLSGVRLFPVQLLEVVWLLAILAGALGQNAAEPGQVFSWYVITYGIGRFFFEFLRADSIRPYARGISEPQWMALGLMCSVVVLESAGIIPFHAWHAASTASLLVLVCLLPLLHRRMELFALHQPHHLKELVEAVNWLCDLAVAEIGAGVSGGAMVEAVTSRRVRLLAAVGYGDEGPMVQYWVSYENATMPEKTARSLAGLIRQVKHPSSHHEMAESAPGVFRLQFPAHAGAARAQLIDSESPDPVATSPRRGASP
jgi:prolipoprotein diacylglyceryltransferase